MKKNVLLLISGIIGTLYLCYIIYYFVGLNGQGGSSTEQLGGAIATALVTPHIVFVGLAVIFGWLGFFLNAKWAALVSGILYAIAMVLFIMYFMFVIIEMILCFVAYGIMKKDAKKLQETN